MADVAKSRSELRQQIICILGMAMVWPSIHNQVLYPLTFSFPDEGSNEESRYLFFLLYALIMLMAVGGIMLAQKKGFAQRLFSSTAAIVAFGVMGACGIAVLVACDFNSQFGRWFMGAGVALSAVFVPVYFMFWSVRMVYASHRRVAFDMLASYLVFCAITIVRLSLGLHAWMFSITYPLVSALFAFLSLRQPVSRKSALGDTPLSGLSLKLVIPTIAFVYLATIGRCLLNPTSAAYDYPPPQRIGVYVALAAFCLVLAWLFRPQGKIRRNASLIAFVLTGVLVIGSILLTGVALTGPLRMGNLPIIAGINAAELYLWIIVLLNAQVKHAGVIRPAAIYLVFVVGASHLATALFLGGIHHLQFDTEQLPLVGITIGLAFLVIVLIMAVMAVLLYKAAQQTPGAFVSVTPEAQAADGSARTVAPATGAPVGDAVPPCLTIAADEAAILRMSESFKLSRREVDTLRLAIRNKPAKEIAETLFIAESTVNSHLKGIYRKCDVHSRQELISLVNRIKREL